MKDVILKLVCRICLHFGWCTGTNVPSHAIDSTSRRHHNTAPQHAQSWRQCHTGAGHSQYTGAPKGDMWVVCSHGTSVTCTTQVFNMAAERHNEPPPHVTRRATKRSHEHGLTVAAGTTPGTTLVRCTSATMSSTSARRTRWTATRRRSPRPATHHKDSDSEFQEQMPNTVDSVAGVQKFITELDDKRCDADKQQYEERSQTTASTQSAAARKESESEERQKVKASVCVPTVYPGGGSWASKDQRRHPRFLWTRTSSHRPALEVCLLRYERLPQSQNPVSTLRTQSTVVRALSTEKCEGQDKIRGL